MNDTSSNNKGPYKNEALNKLYEMLFCDVIDRYKTPESMDKIDWAAIFSENANPEDLQKIADSPDGESRKKILAYQKLSEIGSPSQQKDLLGIIVEVALENGLDTLAAYKDGTARYINQAEKMIIWDTSTNESREIINNLFKEGEIVVNKIGPWENSRLAPPQKGNVRITFLVSHQLYFGEGPIDVLFNDPMGKPMLDVATMLLQYLTQQRS